MSALYRDRYEPTALAGRGAQGEVWKAHDRLHDRAVALKIRRVSGIDRDALLAEARTLLGMRPHEGLPLVRDDFFADDSYVIVMDWIEGRSLATTRASSFEDIVGHLSDVAAALDHLHAHDPPIVHRDVKQQNVIITPEGRTVLVDFGLAGSSVETYLDGTPAYIAPEVSAGGAATPASDVFSLAVTAYVTLTGDFPAPGRQPDLSAIPAGVRNRIFGALREGLAIDPRARPPTATDLVRSLCPPSTPNNLPATLSSFVGRGVESAELRRLLSSSRLVTLVGAGGAGKTRLALHVADAVLPSYPDGVWLAELAAIADGQLTPARIATALGVRMDGVDDPIDALTSFLIDGTKLLVLDNCEHIVDDVAHVVETVLRRCPQLTVLTTSREPLRTTGEAVWSVAPLEATDAIVLFGERVPPGRDPADPQLVRDVCLQLDGIPLAVELAAAQLRTTSLEAIARGLADSIGMLTGGVRTNPRHETMLATIDWSFGRLSSDDQRALRRLSVLVGGFTLEAAEEVAGAAQHVGRLVETSLVARDGRRFRMLEPIRRFAQQKLAEAGELETYRDRHARWVLSLAKHDAVTSEWLGDVAADHDNVEAALVHTIVADAPLAAEIVRNAVFYWTHSGHWVLGREWVRRALERPEIASSARAELLNRAGDMARNQGDLDEAARLLTESVARFDELGDDVAKARALLGLGLTAHALGDLQTAKARQLEAIELARRTGSDRTLAMALNNLAIVHDGLGETDDAIRIFEQCLELLRARGADVQAAVVMLNLAALKRKCGDRPTARSLLDGALATMTEHRYEFGRLSVLTEFAALELDDGEIDRARVRASEALEMARRFNDRADEATTLETLAGIARVEGSLDEARSLHAEALELRRAIGAPLDIAASLEAAAAVDLELADAALATRRLGEAHGLREAAGVPTADRAALVGAQRAMDILGPHEFEREWETGRRRARSRPS